MRETRSRSGRHGRRRGRPSRGDVSDRLLRVSDRLRGVSDRLGAVSDRLSGVGSRLFVVSDRLRGVRNSPGGVSDRPGDASDGRVGVSDSPGGARDGPALVSDNPGVVSDGFADVERKPGAVDPRPGGVCSGPGAVSARFGGVRTRLGSVLQEVAEKTETRHAGRTGSQRARRTERVHGALCGRRGLHVRTFTLRVKDSRNASYHSSVISGLSSVNSVTHGFRGGAGARALQGRALLADADGSARGLALPSDL